MTPAWISIFFLCLLSANSLKLLAPAAITTWQEYTSVCQKAYSILVNSTAENDQIVLDAVEEGIAVCEETHCDSWTGYGGQPDENGETTLDAIIMNGRTMEVGAVGSLRDVKNAIGVARAVMEYTKHSLLVGDLASEFAFQMGWINESLSTPDSEQAWQDWKTNNCQPNFRKNVVPDPDRHCGPYTAALQSSAPIPNAYPNHESSAYPNHESSSRIGHDTVNLIVLDQFGRMAAGASTNGFQGKIPGRVGDTPLAGSGIFVDQTVGGCGCTGAGDITQRFSPCAIAIENMRHGASPQEAATDALTRIYQKWPNVGAVIVVMDNKGEIGLAAMNEPTFYLVVIGAEQKGQPQIITPEPFIPALITAKLTDVDVNQRLRAFIPITAICGVMVGTIVGWILRSWKFRRDTGDTEYLQLTDDEAKAAKATTFRKESEVGLT